MTQGFSVETEEAKKPIILLYGKANPFLDFLLTQFEQEFTLILVSDTPPPSSTIHHINTSSVYLLDKFVEKIDYAIIFLDKAEDKRILTLLSEKFRHDGTRSLAIFPPEQYTLFSDLITQYKSHASVLFLIQGDIFGKIVFTPSPFKTVIQEVFKSNTVTLTGNDLDPIFPISESDALMGIKYLLFGVRHKIKLGFLFYEHPETIVSAIHLLRRVEPDITVKYEDGKQNPTRPALSQIQQYIESQSGIKGSFLSAEFVGFEKSAQELLENKNSVTIPAEKPLKIIQKLNVKKRGDTILFPLFLGLIIFIVMFISLMATTYFLAKTSLQAVRQGNIPQAVASFSSTQSAYELMRPSIQLISSSLPNGTIKINLTTLLNLGDLATQKSFAALTPITLSNGISKGNIDSLIADSLYSFFILKRSESDLSSNNAQKCAFCIINSSEIKQFLTPSLSRALTLLPIAPSLLGYSDSKHYLLLFQNNGELRPSGGFIGSIGELTLTNGKVEDLTIRDVYDLDGQLKTHVEPHYIVRRYLEPHLYLRDSNFSPNFEVSASSAAKLYQLESGKSIDGVIALDFDVLKQIIKVTGPLKLTQYNKTLTEENTFAFLQETIEKKFFPGSTEKKDILNAVFTQITLTLEQRPALLFQIAKIIPQLLDEKHIMVALPDISLQSLFTANGYSGNFFDPRVPTKDTISDTFSLNEANIGVNKSNYTLSRAVNLDINLTASEISTHATITLQNSAKKNYRSYMRILTPANSTLDMITIDGVKQTIVAAVTDYRTYEAARFKAPAGLEVDSTLEGNMHSFGFIIEVSPEKTQMIDIVYKQGQPISSSLFNYSLWYVKQPGTSEYPVTVTVNYPEGYSPQGVTGATFGDNAVVFSQVLRSDQEFLVSLLKKQ